MNSRHTALATLAEAFGRCLITANGAGSVGWPLRPAESSTHRRIRKIARVLDRLARRPADALWHRRAARVHREILRILKRRESRPISASLWAAA